MINQEISQQTEDHLFCLFSEYLYFPCCTENFADTVLKLYIYIQNWQTNKMNFTFTRKDSFARVHNDLDCHSEYMREIFKRSSIPDVFDWLRLCNLLDSTLFTLLLLALSLGKETDFPAVGSFNLLALATFPEQRLKDFVLNAYQRKHLVNNKRTKT